MTNPTSRLRILALGALLGLSLLSPAARAQSNGGRVGPCLAVRVTDADSADLRCGDEIVRVRMRNVATPRPGQLGYVETVRALSELLRARTVFVVPDRPGELPLDANGRVLAYLVDASGANLNVAFVLMGWASYSPESGASQLEASFQSAEHEARAEQRALWTIWSISAERGDGN